MIKTLELLAKNWNPKFWLFVGNGVYLMRCGANGERVYTIRGGVSQSEIVNTFIIPADGGDW